VPSDVADFAYLDDLTEGIERIDAPAGTPDLEEVAALRPDVILGFDFNVEEQYEELSQIAPTVGVEFGETSSNWKSYGRGFAAALGREREWRRELAEYDAEVQRLRDDLGDPSSYEVAILRADADNLRLDLAGIFSGSVLYGDLGLGAPQQLRRRVGDPETAINQPDRAVLEISLEQFRLADAEHLFVWSYPSARDRVEAAERTVRELIASPVLRRLRAVREGNVHPQASYWIGSSVLDARRVVADVREALLP